MRVSPLVLYEGNSGSGISEKSNPAEHDISRQLYASVSPKSVSRDHSKLTLNVENPKSKV